MELDDAGAGAGGGAMASVSEAERFSLLKWAVKDCPSDYAAHLSLLQHLRRERPRSLELLRARQDFSARFPLSPELWQEWIEDRQAAVGENDGQDVLELYRRAFSDYQCAKLWPGYLETLEGSLDEDDEGGVSTMREAFEHALSRVGVHPVLGGAVWRSFLRFEMEELEDAQETGAGDGEVASARGRVKRLYRRQLSVPLILSDDEEASLLEEAKQAFGGDGAGFKEACEARAQARKMLASRMEHEQAIARCKEEDPGGPGEASAWEAYAAMEAGDGHPSRAIFVLERAESEGCCLHERIWITHSDLLLAQMGAKGEEEKLTARAVRNLPWSAELWCRRLRSLERCSDSSSEISSGEGAAAAAMRRVWKDALGSALPSPDEYVKVLLAYCASFRRRLLLAVEAAVKEKPVSGAVNVHTAPGHEGPGPSGAAAENGSGAGVELALGAMRCAFDEAEAFVDKNYPGWDEGWLSVVRQRIQIEDEVIEDIADLGLDGVVAESQARRQWDRVLRHSGKRLASWVAVAKWERGSTGDLAACRRLYARSMKEVQDFPEAAYTAYLNFEQEAGSLEDWDNANKEVFNSRTSRGLLSKDLPLASRSWAGGAAARPLHQPTQRQQNAKNKKQQQQQQRPDDSRGSGKRNSNKRSSPSGGSAASLGNGREGQDEHGDSGDSRSKRPRTSGAAAAGGGGDAAAGGGSKGNGSQKDEGSGAAGVDSLTAFVVNLPFSTTDSGLKDMFKGCGEVTATRVLTHPKGKSKGLGYVTFATEEALAKALALDGTDVEGRALSVERSKPRGSRPAKGVHATTTTAGATTTAATAALRPAAAGEEPSAGSTADGSGMEGAAGGGGYVGGGEAGGAENSGDKAKKRKKKVDAGTGGGASGGIKWPVHPTTVFVRGLGVKATSKDLREAFVGAGAVVEARIVEDKRTRESKGYGLVQFEEEEAVEKALGLDGTTMCGGKAIVSRSRHPAVVASPAPAPASEGVETVGGSASAADANRFSGGQPVVTTLHRPRLQLGPGIRPRALRNERATNGAPRTPAGAQRAVSGGGAVACSRDDDGGGHGITVVGGETQPPPPLSKSNADFRALVNRK